MLQDHAVVGFVGLLAAWAETLDEVLPQVSLVDIELEPAKGPLELD
jgi:hypothetical protein